MHRSPLVALLAGSVNAGPALLSINGALCLNASGIFQAACNGKRHKAKANHHAKENGHNQIVPALRCKALFFGVLGEIDRSKIFILTHNKPLPDR